MRNRKFTSKKRADKIALYAEINGELVNYEFVGGYYVVTVLVH